MSEASPEDGAPLVRTDFSNENAWQSLKSAIADPDADFHALVRYVSDPVNAGFDVSQVVAMFPEGSNDIFVFIADAKTMSDPEMPILVVDLFDERGRSFRVIPSELWSVENNLSIANMDWEDFSENTDEHGVYRGFPE
ncbi:MAG: hypothetical protein AAF612_08245 [Planctomycetota bacterium]